MFRRFRIRESPSLWACWLVLLHPLLPSVVTKFIMIPTIVVRFLAFILLLPAVAARNPPVNTVKHHNETEVPSNWALFCGSGKSTSVCEGRGTYCNSTGTLFPRDKWCADRCELRTFGAQRAWIATEPGS
ncbi:hypothetical protein B0T19DRAFT_398035 [Cercophora scortea]|uniref:Uncharacterized protein n=1 Tax=Cercophora scortea TaxID=314031 RepID=A0AAE0IW04_9PEZI|nr:hypothetical protein B0T19DRAFT_398035 [Cercophora scortea]